MTRRSAVLSAITFVWAAVVLAAYYVYHKPFDLAQAVAIGTTLWSGACASLIIVTSAGAGRAAGRWLRLPLAGGMAALERAAFEGGLGLGLASVVVLVIGLLGGLHWAVAWTLTLGALFIFRRFIREWLRDLKLGLTEMRPADAVEWGLAAFVGLTLAIALLNALGPVVGWDALLYHLTGPKWDIASGRISVPSSIPPLGYSTGVEMLFTWALLIGGERAAAPIHWWFGLLLCLMVWRWGRRWGTGQTAWLSVAVMLSASTVPILAGESYIDVALMFYAAAGFGALIAWREGGGQDWRGLIGAGLMAGLAFGTKFTGGVVGVGLGLVVWLGAESAQRGRIRALAIFGVTAAILCMPWLLKNLILTGNPTYPFFFGGQGWDQWRAEWFGRPRTGWAYTDPLLLLTAPWQMSILGTEGTAWHATIGPLFLLLLPLLAFGTSARSRPLQRWLADGLVLAGVVYALWLYGAAQSRLAMQPRLLFPILPPLAVGAAVAFDELQTLAAEKFSIRRVLGGVLALTLAFTAFQSVADFAVNGPGWFLLGLQTRAEYLYQRLGWHYGAMQAINALPTGSRVVFLFEPRSYYCEPGRCMPDGILDAWWHARRLGGTAESISAGWRADGVTHVLVYSLGAETLERAGTEPFTSEDWQALRELEGKMTRLDSFGNVYELYTLEQPR